MARKKDNHVMGIIAIIVIALILGIVWVAAHSSRPIVFTALLSL